MDALINIMKEGEEEFTAINMLNGNVAVTESYLDVYGAIQGAL